ncbi:hypothetical protein RR48_00950 [Papilio machaon]|uniref:Uncharacterized protein n=1 Tax=Papilio machaon TaxID=76193 RepID=A0A0N1PH91_PAPMA|nr:hypothetical protein RR48_00950 [Papilio machaon]
MACQLLEVRSGSNPSTGIFGSHMEYPNKCHIVTSKENLKDKRPDYSSTKTRLISFRVYGEPRGAPVRRGGSPPVLECEELVSRQKLGITDCFFNSTLCSVCLIAGLNSQQASTATQDKPKLPKKEKPLFPRPKNRIQRTVPKPSNSSTKETPLTNDPLWLESFVIDGETGFVSEEPTKRFNVDAAGYVQLVKTEYKDISDVDKQYAKCRHPHTPTTTILYGGTK